MTPAPLAGIRRRLGVAKRWLRHLPDRLLHAHRHRRAVAQLRDLGIPPSVGMICYGNVCRSPYAEHALRRRLDAMRLDVRVWSAGFFGPDRQPPELALEVAGERGVPLVSHRSQLLMSAPDDRCLVLVMNAWQQQEARRRTGAAATVLVMGDLDPQPVSSREIPDPWGKPKEEFERSYARIDRCLEVLVGAWGA